MSRKARRRLWAIASVITVVAVILLVVYVRAPSAQQADPNAGVQIAADRLRAQKCQTLHNLMTYSQSKTKSLDDAFEDNPAAGIDAYQAWADKMQQYATELERLYWQHSDMARGLRPDSDIAKQILDLIASLQNNSEMATDLAQGSQEIVYLVDYARGDQSPISDENPPPLWIKRYNDIRQEFRIAFIGFENDCPTGGTTKSADQSGSAAASATATAPPSAPAAAGLKKLPLRPSQLASIFGDTGFAPPQPIDPPPNIRPPSGEDVDPPDCAALGTVGGTFSYFAPGSGTSSYFTPGSGHMTGNFSRGARGETAAQLITVWQTPAQADALVAQSSYEWGFCIPNTSFTVTSQNGAQSQSARWMPTEVRDDSESQTSTSIIRLELPAQRTCGHVMASQANIVVEAVVCGDGNADETHQQASTIVHQILYDP